MHHIIWQRLTVCLLAIVQLVAIASLFISPPSPQPKSNQPLVDHLVRSGRSTIDPDFQKTMEQKLSHGIVRTKAVRGTAIILESNTGAIKAVVNPDLALQAWEPGSVMKPLVLGAALTEQTVKLSDAYNGPGNVTIEGLNIYNAIPSPPRETKITDILMRSLNTGAVHLLETLGDGNINTKARKIWYDYMVNHYQFGKPSGLSGFSENPGFVRPPKGGRNITLRYASSSFGVGVAITPLQLASAYGALTNGGTYYEPYISKEDSDQAHIENVVSPVASEQMQNLLPKVLAANYPEVSRHGYIMGGKSGTAPVATENSVYKPGVDNGTYVGFIGKTKPKYILLVRLDEPQTDGFASREAVTVWANIVHKLIEDGLVQ